MIQRQVLASTRIVSQSVEVTHTQFAASTLGAMPIIPTVSRAAKNNTLMRFICSTILSLPSLYYQYNIINQKISQIKSKKYAERMDLRRMLVSMVLFLSCLPYMPCAFFSVDIPVGFCNDDAGEGNQGDEVWNRHEAVDDVSEYPNGFEF